MKRNILIVDDDHIIRESLCVILGNKGFYCRQAKDGLSAFEQLTEYDFDVIITDLEMPKMNGIELMEKASHLQQSFSFIIITAYGSLETAIEALRKGAFDYLLKPLNFEDVAIKVEKLIKHKELLLENQSLRQEVHSNYHISKIIGKSKVMQKVFETITKVSSTNSNVLLSGNSGTGKELVAKAIHYNSERKHRRLVVLNCGAITTSLFESELFGHKKGSFTGAVRDKEGLFKIAHKGTLFLDEIGALDLAAQAKLLRTIENKEILPVGSVNYIKTDVRIIAATHQNLWQKVVKGQFRKDLYYRLNIVELKLPSLSERREDIPLLIRHFIEKYNKQMNRHIKDIDPYLEEKLIHRNWKGEVRELENTIERLMIFASGDKLSLKDLPSFLQDDDQSDFMNIRASSLKLAQEYFEKKYINQVLERNAYHKGNTARELKIGEATLYRKLKEYGIEK